MKVVYISGETIVLEATEDELKKISGDESFTPEVGKELDITQSWDAWLWIKSKKAQILNAGQNLITLGNKL